MSILFRLTNECDTEIRLRCVYQAHLHAQSIEICKSSALCDISQQNDILVNSAIPSRFGAQFGSVVR